jgi:hypothetical protein
MISGYDTVGTMFLGVFPLNLYRLDHEIGPCDVSNGLSGGFIKRQFGEQRFAIRY